MKKAILFTVVFFTQHVFAQTEHVRITEVQVLTGAGTGSSAYGSFADFRSMAPGSRLLQKDFSGFDSRPEMSGDADFFQSFQLGLKLPKVSNAILRAGVSHVIQSAIMNRSGTRSTSAPYDTLTSSQTGEQFYIDSTHFENYRFRYGNKQLRIDGSLIYRLHGDRRWSIYGGIGASVGLAYSSTTELEYSTWNFIGDGSKHDHGVETDNAVLERFENNSQFAASIYLPFGIDFRVGRNREFWKLVHVFLEMRPAFRLNTLPGNGLRTGVGSGSGLGVRVCI